MAIHDGPEDVVETIENVSVRKSLDLEKYDIPTVIYELESGREESVDVTIRESIPDSVSIEDVGFHRNKGAENWKVDGEDLVFEYSLAPGEVCETIYAVRTDTTVVTDDLFTSPEDVDVTPAETAVPTATPMTRSGAESPYGSGDGSIEEEEEEGRSTPAGGVDLDETGLDGEDVPDGSTESLADRLAEEIRAGEVSAESLDVLQDSLLNEADTGGAVDARLTQLQQDVGDLRAYKNALEAFLEDEGSAQEIIEAFEQRLDEVESEVTSLRASVDTLESRSDSHESDIQTMDADIDDISSEHEELVGEFESLAADLDGVEDRLPEYPIDDRMDELESQIESIGEFVDDLKTAFE